MEAELGVVTELANPPLPFPPSNHMPTLGILNFVEAAKGLIGPTQGF